MSESIDELARIRSKDFKRGTDKTQVIDSNWVLVSLDQLTSRRAEQDKSILPSPVLSPFSPINRSNVRFECWYHSIYAIYAPPPPSKSIVFITTIEASMSSSPSRKSMFPLYAAACGFIFKMIWDDLTLISAESSIYFVKGNRLLVVCLFGEAFVQKPRQSPKWEHPQRLGGRGEPLSVRHTPL